MKIFLTVVMLVILSGAAKAQVNSPALQSYQELLKANDVMVVQGTYACFQDDAQSTSFRIIKAMMLSKDGMMAFVARYEDGVSNKHPLVFQGKVFTLAGSLWADLLTAFDKPEHPNETDNFMWGPDTVSFKLGFGKLLESQIRFTNEFIMQRSTGRFVEDSIVYYPSGAQTTHQTGRCVRTPYGTTPEIEYAYFHKESK